MKKILISLLTIIASVCFAVNADDKLIVNGVDFTELKNTKIDSFSWGELINYYAANKTELDKKFKALQLDSKEYARFDMEGKTYLPHCISTFLSVNYIKYNNDLKISEINAIYLFAANYINFNKNGLSKKQALNKVISYQDSFPTDYAFYTYLISENYTQIIELKEKLPFSIIYRKKNKLIKNNVYSEEEIYDLLIKQQKLTDEQIKYRNELFVKLYQKKMLGK